MRAYKFNAKGVAFWGYLMILLIVILMASCGVRKTSGTKESFKGASENKESSTGTTSKTSTNTDESSTKEQVAKSDEKQESKITELFYENGVLKERITELINSKATDNSTKDSKSIKTKINRVDSNFTNTNYRKVLITEHKKTKDTDSDKSFVTNVGGPWMVGFIALLVVVAIFLYFYLKKRR